MVKAKFGTLELRDDGQLVLSMSPQDSSRCMEHVSKQLVEMAAAAGMIIDIDKYLPVLKQRVIDHVFSEHGIIREIIEGQNKPEALAKFDEALSAAKAEYAADYDEKFSDAQPAIGCRARTVFDNINMILVQAAADGVLKDERRFLKAI